MPVRSALADLLPAAKECGVQPVLFHIGEIPVPAYGVLYLTAFLSGIFVFAYLANQNGIRFGKAIDIAFLTVIGGEVGSRLTFLVVEWQRLADGTLSWTRFLVAGRVVLGGVAVGLAVLIWQVRRHRLAPMLFADMGLTGAALGMGIGRLGCLLAGCCYGKPTDAWWGITFHHALAERYNGTPLGVALHPTQPLQAFNGLLIFALLFWWFHRRRYDGQIAGWFWILAGATRFLVEFLRGDPRGATFGLATSQWLGLAGIAVGVAWLKLASRAARGTPRVGG